MQKETPAETPDVAKLKQKFGDGSEWTKVFDEWPESIQTYLLKHSEMENEESPILAFYQPDVSWFVLTTQRLLWTNPDQQFYELRLENVETVGWSSGPEGWSARDPVDPPDGLVYINYGQVEAKGHCSHYSPWLHFVDSSGKRFEAFLEKGNLRQIKNMIWQMSGGWKSAFVRAEKENQATKANDPELGSDAYRANRLEKALLSQGKSYSSWFFRSLSPEIQEFFLLQGPFDQSELTVYGYFESSETWFLATSRRALWSRPGFICRLRYNKIYHVGMSEMERINRENPEELKEVTRVKGSSPWLYFQDIHGQRHEALLPPGSDLFAIWNSMLFMVQLEKIHPSALSN